MLRLFLYLLVGALVAGAVFLLLAELGIRLIYPLILQTEIGLGAIVYAMASPPVTSFFIVITTLGYVIPTIVITIILVVILALYRGPIIGAWLAFTMIFGEALMEGIKDIVRRARPDQFRLADATDYSFPSGHALLGVVLYGGFLLALWPRVKSPLGRLGIVLFGFLMPLLLGLSRIYLGVHYPTDALGGWLLGTMWLFLSWRLLREVLKRSLVKM